MRKQAFSYVLGLVLVLGCFATFVSAQDSQEGGKPGNRGSFVFQQYDASEIQARARDAMQAAARKAALDGSRPVFHFRPQSQWMNDVCGAFFHQGWHHVFYQYNPWADTWGKGVGWGHARSRDLVHWEWLPPALLPDRDNGSTMDASGSAAFDANGQPVIFFAKTPAKGAREQWAAVPEDGDFLRWRRVDLGLAPGKNGVPVDVKSSWADMFAFTTGGQTFATFKSADGLICKAQRPDLLAWKAVGRVDGLGGECPNLFPLTGRYGLILSTLPISYRVGEFDPEKISFRFAGGEARVLDYGVAHLEKGENGARGLYGTTVFTDGKGRSILLGWLSGFKPGRGWNGCMALPRILTLVGDEMIQTPIPELQELRGKASSLNSLTLNGESKIVEGVRGDNCEIMAQFRPGTAKSFGLRIHGQGRTDGVVVSCNPAGINSAGLSIPYSLSPDRPLKLHVFFDRTVMELFVDDGRCVSTRVVYPNAENLQVEVFATDGMVELTALQVWEIKPIW